MLLLSHLLAPANFDQCAIYASSSLVMGNLCELGINISCLKFSAGTTGEDWLRTVSRFLVLRLALTASIVTTVFLLAPALSARLLAHPEYSIALRLSCGSAAVASISSFSLVLLQSRLEFARMSWLSAVAALLQLLPVLAALRYQSFGIASLFAGDVSEPPLAGDCQPGIAHRGADRHAAPRPASCMAIDRRLRQLDYAVHRHRIAL